MPCRGEGCTISPPLRGGDEGEGDVCGFTNDRIGKNYSKGCNFFHVAAHFFIGLVDRCDPGDGFIPVNTRGGQ